MRVNRSVAAMLFVFLSIPAAAATTRPARRVPFRPLTVDQLDRIPHDGRKVFLQAAVFDPTTEAPDFAEAALESGEPTDYVIVQFRPGSSDAKARLERHGIRFFGYLPDNSFQARVPASNRDVVAADPAVRWVGEYVPGYKVHARLWPGSSDTGVDVTIRVFPDAPISKTALLLRSKYPEAVQTQLREATVAPLVRFAVPYAQREAFVRDAARMSDVSWIEPYDAPNFLNFDSTGPIQGNADSATGRTLFAHGITGTGQIVAVADTGVDNDMCFFRNLNGVNEITPASRTLPPEVGPTFPNRKIFAYWVQPGADAYDTDAGCNDVSAGFHGSHTSGTAVGDNFAHLSSRTDGGIDPGDGMAPNGQLLFQDIGAAGGCLAGGGLYEMFLQASNGGARVHSNSYGGNSAGAYSTDDEVVDRFLFDRDEMTIVFSAGNNGAGAMTTGSPGNAKNAITVGALQHGASLLIAPYSSRGPTADGRIKPDIVAPGSNIRSAAGDLLQEGGNCGIKPMSGTSMSAPTAAGGAALLRQYFGDGFYPTGAANAADAWNATASLVKAALLNGALPVVNGVFGDFKFGWGRIFLDNNLYFKNDTRKLRAWNLANTEGLSTGQSHSYRVKVSEGQEFRATLVWSDPEGTPGAASTLVNNLDLTVTAPGGAYLGNVIGTDSISAQGGAPDEKNNVEQVRFAAPNAGVYTITVAATNVPGNGRSRTDRQGYALLTSFATCDSAVTAVPTGLAATSHAVMGIDLSWTPAAGSTVTQIYRAKGATSNPAEFQYVGTATGATYTDGRAQGGETYTYKVRGADDCGEGPASSTVTITSTGSCDIGPEFAGIATAAADGNNCRIGLAWSPAKANCPLGQSVRYNIYRSTTPDFVPAGAPLATVSGTTFSDTSVSSGVTYYFVVRAEDGVAGSTGPHGGNEESNATRLNATAFGVPGATGTWTDDGGDTNAYLSPQLPWRVSSQDHQSGARAYRTSPNGGVYPSDTCASLTTPELQLGDNAELSYWARFNLEFQWDGVVVEISTDGGTTWSDLAPAAGYPNTLSETLNPPVNACGFPSTRSAFTGPFGNTQATPWTEYRSSLASYSGMKVRIRWRLTTDPGLAYEGFFLDTISVSKVNLPTACIPTGTKPVARFNVSPLAPPAGSTVRFTDISDGSPTSWNWTFGDGSSSAERNPVHTWAAAATYVVTLTVTNPLGSSSGSREVVVLPPGSDTKRRRTIRK